MARPELTVMGGGIFGLSIAWEAVRRGACVRVIEIDRIGAGASGGVVGALAPHAPEQWNAKKAFQLDSLLLAEGWWSGVEAASGLSSGYGRTGRLQPLADTRAVEAARERGVGATALWQGRAVWEVVPAEGAWAPFAGSGWMVRDTLTARIHPRHALAALVAAIRGAGSEVVEGCAEAVGPVIWATGVAGLQALSEQAGRPVGGAVKGQAMVLDFDAGNAPQIFVDGLHIVPHGHGTVAVGSTSEHIWQDPDATDEALDTLRNRAIAACPNLADARVIERWAGLRPRATTRAPILGEWPARPGQFIANGGFKIGFGMAPKVAEVMVDLVVDGRDTIPPAFRVETGL